MVHVGKCLPDLLQVFGPQRSRYRSGGILQCVQLLVELVRDRLGRRSRRRRMVVGRLRLILPVPVVVTGHRAALGRHHRRLGLQLQFRIQFEVAPADHQFSFLQTLAHQVIIARARSQHGYVRDYYGLDWPLPDDVRPDYEKWLRQRNRPYNCGHGWASRYELENFLQQKAILPKKWMAASLGTNVSSLEQLLGRLLAPDRCSKLLYAENRDELHDFCAGTQEPDDLERYLQFLAGGQYA